MCACGWATRCAGCALRGSSRKTRQNLPEHRHARCDQRIGEIIGRVVQGGWSSPAPRKNSAHLAWVLKAPKSSDGRMGKGKSACGMPKASRAAATWAAACRVIQRGVEMVVPGDLHIQPAALAAAKPANPVPAGPAPRRFRCARSHARPPDRARCRRRARPCSGGTAWRPDRSGRLARCGTSRASNGAGDWPVSGKAACASRPVTAMRQPTEAQLAGPAATATAPRAGRACYAARRRNPGAACAKPGSARTARAPAPVSSAG